MSTPLKIFIVDDHPVIKDALPGLLEQDPNLQVIGSAMDAYETLKRLRYLSPDVILLDISLPMMSGLDAIEFILNEVPATRILVFSMHEKESYVHRALRAGALGYVVKGSSIGELVEAIYTVANGDYFLSKRMKQEVFKAYLKERRDDEDETSGYDSLTEREQQVFHLLVAGSSIQQISSSLDLSQKTVEKHQTSIKKKLGARNLVDMVKRAVQLGIIDTETWRP